MTPRNDDVLVVDVHSGSVRSVPWLRTPAALPCPCPPGAHDYDLANPGCPRTTFDARHDEARASGRELVAFVDGTNNVRWGFLKRSAELEM